MVAVSYADGCCRKSLERNRKKALEAGLHEARGYGRKDLDPAWVAQNKAVLSQRKGAGWWLWKPHVILRTLEDPAVPWHRGVVAWTDAGNYIHANPTPLISSAMRESDVLGLRLKWCIEAEWTNVNSSQALNVSDRYSIMDRPQIGAYFLLFRKTEVAIKFVKEWLKLSEDPLAVMGAAAGNLSSSVDSSQSSEDAKKKISAAERVDGKLLPGFQKHQADQSVFSVLFKKYGFAATSLEEGHKYVTLDRWRE